MVQGTHQCYRPCSTPCNSMTCRVSHTV
ncbi:hypothetical protein F383_18744 [Gossypium arboreum]|uniref:Uncharacterized protein n=1 Tax=Gossypium arboreum TaxID=29729 RepID=A0A0B0ND02_GOSAR|nr:hypothetical protein F383_18744 [Gossypium arboreum]